MKILGVSPNLQMPFSSYSLVEQKNRRPALANGIHTPVENGLSHKEEEEGDGKEVHRIAAKVVEDVVKLASEAAEERAKESPPAKKRGCDLQSAKGNPNECWYFHNGESADGCTDVELIPHIK
ncbi:uncharacterized protein CDAR_104231 [Caerostris darwini]|uniref:Uncharacterized protein n=1 Tax=Caerostris darwini TaxID=1538125 RepID=A0AAV4PUE6_9ARAC|nr:uncharacterized protein CDAR_104231 [Caerostris darwini]